MFYKVAIWPLFFYTLSMKLELYFYRQCPFCAMVLHKIKQLELEDKIEMKNTLENADFHKFHYEKTGRTTVPCLYIDDEPLFESQDIMKWLEENKNKI